jgi:hypothetical protein
MLALGANLLGVGSGHGCAVTAAVGTTELVLAKGHAERPKGMPNERCLTSALPRPGHSLLADAERRARPRTKARLGVSSINQRKSYVRPSVSRFRI